jgi:3-phenylpropionate/trans-cinnamate dioxygenase ferredoxin subunit
VLDPEELGVGEKRQVIVDGKAIVVGRISSSEYFAVRDVCPHQGAELSRGTLAGTTLPCEEPGEYTYARPFEILRCPWHAWEFDVRTGENIYQPNTRFRVKTYDVDVEADGVFVDV